jgi:uncharacterized BrkB/YihY/UPF0761 family membrane protein
MDILFGLCFHALVRKLYVTWRRRGGFLGRAFLVLFVLLLLYRFLPARRQSWLRQVPGAVFGAVGFYLLKRGFDYWASQSAGIGALPRSLVSVVLLLVWLGFFGQLILYGAALNVVLDRRRRGEPILPGWPPDALGEEMPAAPGPDASGPPLPSHREARAPPTP